MRKIIRRNIASSLLLGTLLFTSVACDVLEKEPIENLSPESVFSSPQRIEKAVIGIYDDNQNVNFLGGRVLVYADIRGADTDPATYFGGIGLFSPLSNDATVTAAWTGGYRAIYTANLFLQGLEENRSKVPTAALAMQYEAEARFIRALNHWYLVNLFAQPFSFTADGSHLGIPISLKAFDATNAFSPEAQLARSTVAQVYAQIEEDLKFGVQHLPSRKGVAFGEVARATKGAAEALLMRLYLYKRDYAKAIAQADKVAGMGYRLNAAPATAFTDYTTWESIFSVAHNVNDNPNTNSSLGQHYGADHRKDVSVNPYLSLFSENSTDLRITTLTKLAVGKVYTTKYVGNFSWVPVIRYPEVLLSKAEALVKGSNSVEPEAVTLLNTVSARANGTTYQISDFASSQDLLETILLERRRELAFEGHGMFDLLRNKKDIPANGNNKLQPYGSDKTILPIPQIDIQANPKLQQNPGY